MKISNEMIENLSIKHNLTIQTVNCLATISTCMGDLINHCNTIGTETDEELELS